MEKAGNPKIEITAVEFIECWENKQTNPIKGCHFENDCVFFENVKVIGNIDLFDKVNLKSISILNSAFENFAINNSTTGNFIFKNSIIGYFIFNNSTIGEIATYNNTFNRISIKDSIICNFTLSKSTTLEFTIFNSKALRVGVYNDTKIGDFNSTKSTLKDLIIFSSKVYNLLLNAEECKNINIESYCFIQNLIWKQNTISILNIENTSIESFIINASAIPKDSIFQIIDSKINKIKLTSFVNTAFFNITNLKPLKEYTRFAEYSVYGRSSFNGTKAGFWWSDVEKRS